MWYATASLPVPSGMPNTIWESLLFFFLLLFLEPLVEEADLSLDCVAAAVEAALLLPDASALFFRDRIDRLPESCWSWEVLLLLLLLTAWSPTSSPATATPSAIFRPCSLCFSSLRLKAGFGDDVAALEDVPAVPAVFAISGMGCAVRLISLPRKEELIFSSTFLRVLPRGMPYVSSFEFLGLGGSPPVITSPLLWIGCLPPLFPAAEFLPLPPPLPFA